MKLPVGGRRQTGKIGTMVEGIEQEIWKMYQPIDHPDAIT